MFSKCKICLAGYICIRIVNSVQFLISFVHIQQLLPVQVHCKKLEYLKVYVTRAVCTKNVKRSWKERQHVVFIENNQTRLIIKKILWTARSGLLLSLLPLVRLPAEPVYSVIWWRHVAFLSPVTRYFLVTYLTKYAYLSRTFFSEQTSALN